MKFKKILITGAAGFIGYHIIKSLLNEGIEMVGLDNINDYYNVNLKYARLAELGIPAEKAKIFGQSVQSAISSEFRFIRMNLEDKEALSRLFKKEQFDAVINMAAQAGVRYSIENPSSYIESNIVGFLNILEACRNNKIKHLVYASSSSVYGESAKVPFSEDDKVDHPISLYAATKKSNELMAHTYSHLYKIPTSGLRFFTVYGPWGRPDMAPILFANAIINNQPIKVFNNGNMSRDFTYIDDIIKGILVTLNNPSTQDTAPYQLFNIGNGSPLALDQFINELELNLGKVAEKIFMPMQPGDVSRTWADMTHLKNLGYKSTTSIHDGVKSFVDWFKTSYVEQDGELKSNNL